MSEDFWPFLDFPSERSIFITFVGGYKNTVRVDFREGDEDSNFSLFRVWRFTEWPGPLH